MSEVAKAVGPITAEEVEAIMTSIESGKDSGRPDDVVQLDGNGDTMLKEFVNAAQLKKDVSFNANDLDASTQTHASMFVHYADLARLAARQYARMDAAFKILESQLDHAWREQMKKENPKATEAAILGAVRADPRWWRGQQRVIDAKAIADLARDAREAFSHRKDMIVQTSVDRRKEREGELRVMVHKTGMDSVTEAAERAKRTMEGITGQGGQQGEQKVA